MDTAGWSFVTLATATFIFRGNAVKLRALFGYTVLLITLAFPGVCLADTVWIDVRSPVEHTLDSIDGDLRITHSDIVPEVEALFPDKNTHIKLYCRSGGRAAQAAQALEDAGYQHVEAIGGIDDARSTRGIDE
tara:strand:+ start:485 stop:883 length:399 start_codon:yes stop_codon:yes gene_type:complete